MKYLLLSALLVALLTGCTTARISESSQQQVRASMPNEEGAVHYSQAANWFPNLPGIAIGWVKWIEVVKQTPSINGVVVITDRSLLFMSWGGGGRPGFPR